MASKNSNVRRMIEQETKDVADRQTTPKQKREIKRREANSKFSKEDEARFKRNKARQAKGKTNQGATNTAKPVSPTKEEGSKAKNRISAKKLADNTRRKMKDRRKSDAKKAAAGKAARGSAKQLGKKMVKSTAKKLVTAGSGGPAGAILTGVAVGKEVYDNASKSRARSKKRGDIGRPSKAKTAAAKRRKLKGTESKKGSTLKNAKRSKK